MLGALPLVRYRIFGRAARSCWGTNSGILAEMADLRVPLLDREWAEPVLRAMLEFLHTQRTGNPGLLDLGKVPFDDPFRSMLLAVCADLDLPYRLGDSYERGAIVRRDEDHYWEKAITAKRRHDIKRRKRALERDHGGSVVLRDRSADQQFIPEFIDFESNGWKGQAGSGGRGLQVSTGAADWFSEVFGELQRQHRVIFHSLEIGEDVLYMSACLSSGDTMFCWRDAYAEKWARYGTGFLGRLAAMELFNGRPQLAYLDTTTIPEYATTTAMYPDRRRISALVIAVGGLPDRSLIRSLPHLKQAGHIMARVQAKAGVLVRSALAKLVSIKDRLRKRTAKPFEP